MFLSCLMLAVLAGDGFSFQVNPGALAETAAGRTLALTINNQATVFRTLAKQPTYQGEVWIGQGVNRPDLAVLGLKQGHQIFGMIRDQGVNWQIHGDAATVIEAVALGRVPETSVETADNAYVLTEEVRTQIEAQIEPNPAPASRVDVLLTYNDLLLESMSREDIEFALRVNLAFANFVLESSQVALTLVPVGFLAVPISDETSPSGAYLNLRFELYGGFAMLKQWRYRYRPDMTHVVYGCGVPGVSGCDPNIENYYQTMKNTMNQYLIDPMSFARAILGTFGTSRGYRSLPAINYSYGGAPLALYGEEGGTLGTFLSDAQYLLPFLSGSPRTQGLFSNDRNNYACIDFFRTKVEKLSRRQVTAANFGERLPAWGTDITVLDLGQAVGVRQTKPVRVIPPGDVRTRLIEYGWDYNQDGEITEDEIDVVDRLEFTSSLPLNGDGLEMLTGLKNLTVKPSVLAQIPLEVFENLDELYLSGALDGSLVLRNESVRELRVYDRSNDCGIDLEGLPNLLRLDIDAYYLTITGLNNPWLSYLNGMITREITVNEGEPWQAPLLQIFTIYGNNPEIGFATLNADLDLGQHALLDQVLLDAAYDPTTVLISSQVTDLQFRGDSGPGLPWLPPQNRLRRLTLANIDAGGLQALTLPAMTTLNIHQSGLTALPELPMEQFESLTDLNLSGNQIRDLNAPVGYGQLSTLSLENNGLDETHCAMIQVLQTMGLTVRYQFQTGQQLTCPD